MDVRFGSRTLGNDVILHRVCDDDGRWAGTTAIAKPETRSAVLELGLDGAQVAYTPLGDLPTATEKARRDAPAIAVCAI